MDKTIFFVCDILCKNDDRKFRIIQIRNEKALLVEMEIDKLNLQIVEIYALDQLVESNYYHIESVKKTNYFFESYTDEQKLKIDTSYSIVTELLSVSDDYLWLIGPKKGHYVKLIATKYNVTPKTVYKYLRIYLQGGMNRISLIPQYKKCGGKGKKRNLNESKPGPKGFSSNVIRNSEVEERFEIMLKRYKASNGKMTIKSLYDDLIMRYYSEIIKEETGEKLIPMPVTQIPSIRQFRYFFNNKIGTVEKYIISNGKGNARNNIRPLFSDTLERNLGAGHIFEIDECETQFYLVSTNDRKRVIGRAIMYAIVDVYSRMIVGISVGLNNNSWNGVNLALLNMVEDKVKFCRSYGIDIKEKDWPVMNGIPKIFRCDNGSEYISKYFMNLVQEIGVTISHVPPRSGSLKSLVEQKFNQINKRLDGKIPGQIYKEYGSQHIKNATLNINEFTKIIIEFVLNYNTSIMKNYPLNTEMISQMVKPEPLNIWNYSVKKHGCIRRIESKDLFMYSLLQIGKAKITRNGIKFKGLYYLVNDLEWLTNQMYIAGMKNKTTANLEIRYDSRTTEKIFFVNNNKIVSAELNNRKASNLVYCNKNWNDVEQIRENHQELLREEEYFQIARDLELNYKINNIVSTAKKEKKNCKTVNNFKISSNRRKEKSFVDSMNNIEKKLSGTLNEILDTEIMEGQNNSLNIKQYAAPVLSGNSIIDIFKKNRTKETYADE